MLNLPYGFCSHQNLFVVFASLIIVEMYWKMLDLWTYVHCTVPIKANYLFIFAHP